MYRCLQSRAAVEGGYCSTNNLLLSRRAITNARHSSLRRYPRYAAGQPPRRTFSVTPTWFDEDRLPQERVNIRYYDPSPPAPTEETGPNHVDGDRLPQAIGLTGLTSLTEETGTSLYPRFPVSLWHQNYHAAFRAFLRICRTLKLTPTISPWYSVINDDLTHFSLRIQIKPGIIAATKAEAKNTLQAGNQAMTQLLTNFHRRGILSDLHEALEDCQMHLSDPDSDWFFESDAHKAFRDAQDEVYNLCVRLGTLPEFECHIVFVQHSLLHLPDWPKGMPVSTVTISVPELDVNVSSTSARNALLAGIAACAMFKTRIQNMLRSGALKAKTTLLSVDTAPDFIRFFGQMLRRQVDYDMHHGRLQYTGFRQTVIRMDGLLCAASVPMALRKSSARLAKLVVAFQLVKQNPDLAAAFAMDKASRKPRKPRGISPIPLQLGPAVRRVLESVTTTVSLQELKPMKPSFVGVPAPHSALRKSGNRPFSRSCLADGPEKDNLNEAMRRRLQEFRAAPEFENMRQKQASLPMSHQREQVLEMIHNARNPFSIIVGATGSGKSTQVPQFILDDAIVRGVGADCHIICTQPRRIAVASVAARVAHERGEPLRDSVGFQIRHEATLPREHGSITFCTAGLLLQQLKADAPGVLSYVSHILIDEVHERDLQTDFLMAMLKKFLKQREKDGLHVPKVALMSATLDPELFADYFPSVGTGGELVPAPCIRVPGRTFPVENRYIDDILADLNKHHQDGVQDLIKTDRKLDKYLKHELSTWRDTKETEEADAAGGSLGESCEESVEETFQNPCGPPGESLKESLDLFKEFLDDRWTAQHQEDYVPIRLVAATIAHICKTTTTGAILVFLPGLKNIRDTERVLVKENILKADIYDKSMYRIHILHSSMPREEQMAIFRESPPGCRNIILSTNIAETSITVPDVQYVVDAGKLRERRYDQLTRISCLQYVWESKSNARQRAGRAGRVQNGFYYALFSRDRHAQMAAAGQPEVLRADLQETCLAIAKQNFDEPVAEILAEFIEPPSGLAVIAALQSLRRLKALTHSEQLTPLGVLLAKLPVHPRLAKMVLLGVIFRCLDPLIILAAAEGAPPLLISPTEDEDMKSAKESRRNFQGHFSDHIAVLEAYKELRALDDEFSIDVPKRIARDLFLRWDSYCTIRKNAKSILDDLVDSGLVPQRHDRSTLPSHSDYGPESMNENSHNMELVRGLLVAGLYPNLAVQQAGTSYICKDVGTVLLHPSSENVDRRLIALAKHGRYSPSNTTIIAFSDLERPGQARSELYARETTLVEPLTTVLFAEDKTEIAADATNGVTISPGGWLPFLVQNVDGDGAADDDGARNMTSLRTLLDFKLLIDAMLDRAYADMSKRTRNYWLSGEHLRRTRESELLRQTMVEAVLHILNPGAEVSYTDTEAPDADDEDPDTGAEDPDTDAEDPGTDAENPDTSIDASDTGTKTSI